ncbi:hypothetical protein J2Z79_000776 [Symbiobacterium terraclitae]|uniref:Uncharacterized protein n=1 Tax=Symbiobacterium terraclitae TaxID=557451 RepID=A0ABS4JPD7_9FIRM|nr:hypothetical protein [Symbiobacterium terraclitae]MBP2017393.1 hypothetical protein [Symbiobacterium terraclitae]
MLFQVTPETHALICLLIMAVAFIIAQYIGLPDPSPAPRPQRRPEPRRRARSRACLRVIHTH